MNARRDFRDLGGADPWKLLDVPRDADAVAIKRSYRHLSRTNHSDVGGDPARQAKLNRAYAILSDPVRRAEYARLLSARESPGAARDAGRKAGPGGAPETDPLTWSSGTPPRTSPSDPYADPYAAPRAQDSYAQNPYAQDPYTRPYNAEPYQPYESPPGPPPESPGLSGQAVAALLTVPFCAPLSIFLAVSALSTINRTGQRGRPLAHLALLLNAAMFLTVLTTLGYRIYRGE